jgi:hypothetical protein
VFEQSSGGAVMSSLALADTNAHHGGTGW